MVSAIAGIRESDLLDVVSVNEKVFISPLKRLVTAEAILETEFEYQTILENCKLEKEIFNHRSDDGSCKILLLIYFLECREWIN